MRRAFDYQCAGGHITERWVESERVPKSCACLCGRRARRVFSPPHLAAEFFPGDSELFRTQVRSKRHLKRLQKERGLCDYEPVRDRSSDWMEKGRRGADQLAAVPAPYRERVGKHLREREVASA